MADEAPATESPAADQPASTSNGTPTMAVKVYAPFKVYFEGDAMSVSAVNDTGPFDILPKHHILFYLEYRLACGNPCVRHYNKKWMECHFWQSYNGLNGNKFVQDH